MHFNIQVCSSDFLHINILSSISVLQQGNEIYLGKTERDKIQLKLSTAINIIFHFQIFFIKPVKCNLCYNILQLCNILIHLWMATSKTKLYLKSTKIYIKIASHVAKQIKTWDSGKIRIFRKISKLGKVLAQ